MDNGSANDITQPTIDRRRSSTASSSRTPSTTSRLSFNSGNLTSKKATEILVNWAIDTGQGGTLSTNLGPSYTSAFAMLDCRGLDGGSLRTPANIGYDMDSAIKDMDKSKRQVEAGRYLRDQLNKSPEYQSIRKAVEQELDQELKSRVMVGGMLEPWDSNLAMSLDAKIIRVAGQRVMGKLFEASGSMPVMESEEDKHVEFQVQLERLVDGMGDCSQTTTMRFAYTTSYCEFLKALQEATSLCRIPPRHSTELRTGERGFFKPIQLFSSANDDQTPPTDLAALAAPKQRRGSVELSIHPLANKDKPQGREVKGYTEDDGAWVYRTIKSLDPASIWSHEKHGRLKVIKDGADYREMVLTLKSANSGEKKAERETKIVKSTPVSVKSLGSSPPRLCESGSSTPTLLETTNSRHFRMDHSRKNTPQPSELSSSPFHLNQSGMNTPYPAEKTSSSASRTSEAKDYTFGIWIMHSQDFVEREVWKKAFKDMREEDGECRRSGTLEGQVVPELWSVYWEREGEKSYF